MKKINFKNLWKKLKAGFRRSPSMGEKFEPIDTSDGSIVFLSIPITMIFISLLSLLVFVYPAIAILSDPDGLAGVVGRMLASYCLSSGQCNFYNLLPSFAIAVIILTDLAIYFVFLFIGISQKSMGDTLDDLGNQLNDRLETLRKDLTPSHNEMAWALNAIWDMTSSYKPDDSAQLVCKLRQIAGETMGLVQPAAMDDCEPVVAKG